MHADRAKTTEFQIRVNNGEPQPFASRHSIYTRAVMEAFGVLGMPYPCRVEIWHPDLVDAGYGPYRFVIADFVDSAGNRYGCPAVMTAGSTQND